MQALYYVFATLLLFAALMVISVRNPVYAALFLVLAFFCAAGLWLLLYAEFLALVLVLIYVGAVMVLFLFVVMMLDIKLAPLQEGFVRHFFLGLILSVALLGSMWFLLHTAWIFQMSAPTPPLSLSTTDNTQRLGELLFEKYYYPFELSGALLLVASVAAIGLTLRQRRATRTPASAQQVRVRRADRVRLVDLESGGGGEREDA